ncbi:hypothetical protein AJ80_08892 [Polytolypa hystricis UAMH7299]|uniref:Uncharacterized protein n=1 Tax=Polytolypa hystricis (strain UAMH7299) TaxID=1447883 RepID=A0A2B7X0C8_POLH7|nr:hypothetical protein AJ80_08892 [Polytolypa hystricis UAMH7299]
MAATLSAISSLVLRLKVQPPRSLLSICKGLHPNLHHQPARLAHRPSGLLATRLPTHLSQFNRPFMSSQPRASSQETMRSIGMEWYELSTARKIQWDLGDSKDAKWGWVIYRCTYKPELDGYWESFKCFVNQKSRQEIAKSDAPEIAEKLDWVFVEDPELEGASREELKRRFRAWARTEQPNIDSPGGACRGSRYTYFIQVDEGALLSFNGHVNIVRGWQDPPPPEEAMDEFGEVIDNEDWMMMQASMIAPYFYIELDNDESWYVHYSAPPHGMCVW